MSYLDYFRQLVGAGGTGTDDPSQAGIDPQAQPDPYSMQNLRAMWYGRPSPGFPRTYPNVSEPPSPASFMSAANAPQPAAAPSTPPAQALSQYGTGGALQQAAMPDLATGNDDQSPQNMPILSRAATGENVAPSPFPGQGAVDRNVRLVGPDRGVTPPDYYTPGGAQTAAAPQQQQSPANPFGNVAQNTLAQAAQLQQHPAFQFSPVASQKPNWGDNLLRFGLAAMAAGGKPGATTLGALGEGGLSALDYAQKAKQADITNAFENQKLGILAQDQISKAYERADALDVRAQNTALSIQARQEAAAQANAIRQSAIESANAFRAGNLQVAQDKLQELQNNNQLLAQGRADKLVEQAQARKDREQTSAEKAYEQHQKIISGGVGGMAMTDQQKDLLATARTARAYPNSTYAQVWQSQRADIIADAKASIAKGAPAATVLQRLAPFGIGAADLQ